MSCTCTHPRAAHPGRGRCALNGCACVEFADTEATPREEPDGKTVVLVVPDGFALNVTLTPIGEVAS